MSLIIDGQMIVGPGNSPYVGENGNWFVGKKDTGYHAGTDIYYKTESEFSTCYEEGVYYVYSEEDESIKTWHINSTGRKSLVTSQSVMVPVVGSNGNWFIGDVDLGISTRDGQDVAGASINDEAITTNTVWSSYKINNEIDAIKKNGGIPGKGLEFTWKDTELGVRQEGTGEYLYKNLRGPVGIAGLDGSSILDAEIDGNGHLLVTVQDTEDPRETHEILSIEGDTFTKNDLKSILNSINRLNREIYNIKRSQYRMVIPISYHTDGEYKRVYKFDGSGNCQIVVNKFTGAIRVTADGAVYTVYADDLESLSESSLVSISTNGQLVMSGLFTGTDARGLDIPYLTSLTIEVLITENDENCYPRFLLQGIHYQATANDPDAGGGDYIPTNIMTAEDVDIMMGLT